ncbi:SRPBCC domain-containing protein [Actinoplanes sp. NPDC051411]|uniref:SRPBCC domain-containing protein n=1 Tax=Actinoplanes sp. NPDC051411 TaxID=3155522 RepID=UPI0034378998
MKSMEYGSLVKEIHIAASPAVVYEVISTPEHIRQWWTDDAEFALVAGGTGTLTFSNRARTRPGVVPLTVLEAVPGKRFVFRWDYGSDPAPTPENSLLVTFELIADGDGTLLRVTEDGFRERGREATVLEDYYRRHDDGWDVHLADLRMYTELTAALR